MIRVLIHNETNFPSPDAVLIDIVRQICHDHGFRQGEVSLAIVDDKAIHALNRQHLQHDYPTDVLSFPLEQSDALLEGEVVVSADTAMRMAADYGWTSREELLLYFIHGTLHLVGHDDHNDHDRAHMRDREQHYLAVAGISSGNARRADSGELPQQRETSA